MKQKKFYEAFDLLYTAAKEALYISQKEEFYRMLFKDIYALSDDGLFDNDAIRKITSGNGTIHITVKGLKFSVKRSKKSACQG